MIYFYNYLLSFSFFIHFFVKLFNLNFFLTDNSFVVVMFEIKQL